MCRWTAGLDSWRITPWGGGGWPTGRWCWSTGSPRKQRPGKDRRTHRFASKDCPSHESQKWSGTQNRNVTENNPRTRVLREREREYLKSQVVRYSLDGNFNDAGGLHESQFPGRDSAPSQMGMGDVDQVQLQIHSSITKRFEWNIQKKITLKLGN